VTLNEPHVQTLQTSGACGGACGHHDAAFHVLTLSHWGLNGGSYAPRHAFVSVAAAIRANLAIEALYFLVIVAVSYHFANGLWTGAIAWGALYAFAHATGST
jgi:succinate dehydrogenase/fumarate reductase cytochrome b subunit